jgi:sterol desaturase/sphingolipid hydroxylase (fatty acid hydroxylase superfamily)
MYAFHVLPLMALGAPEPVLVGFTVWSLLHGFFQHANIDMRLGPLNYIFSMAELHRWHHSRKIEEANNNYGSNCIVWDLVFGTFFWPRDRRPPEDVGLSGLPGFPQRVVGQLLSPFNWPRKGK